MIAINGEPFTPGRFPDGTALLRLEPGEGPVLIEWYYEGEAEMALLWYLVSHLREGGAGRTISLYLPYVPNARMDRVKARDEVFTLKYFALFLNSLAFDTVTVRDAHSPVSLALIDRVVQEDIGPGVRALAARLLPKGGLVFFPDEGASKRYGGLLVDPVASPGSAAQAAAPAGAALMLAFGIKKRDWRTGRIDGLDVHGEVPGAPFDALIIDDICSYGGTFLHSARKLKELGAGRIFLYITHCEHAILEGDLLTEEHGGRPLIERVYTTKSIFLKEHPRVEVLDGAGVPDTLPADAPSLARQDTPHTEA